MFFSLQPYSPRMSTPSNAAPTSALTGADAAREKAEQAFGMVPNLIQEISARNPALAHAYLDANAAIADGALSPAEREVVILAISSYNDCHYCTKAHAAAGKGAGLSADTVETVVAGGLPDDERHRTLVQATRRILGKRGWLSDDDQAEFAGLGLDRGVLYEIVGLIGIKTISNYVNHIAHTEVDAAFK
jgi:AhpD family alkylhydroperoxidase